MKNMVKKLVIFLAFSLLIYPLFIFAQEVNPPIQETEVQNLTQSIGEGSLAAALTKIFSVIFTIIVFLAGALAVIFIAWGGINVIIQNKMDEGKNRLIFGAIGLAIALLSWGFVQVIKTFVTSKVLGQ